MGNIPGDRRALLNFANAHKDKWQQNAAGIGLTSADVTSMKAAITAVDGQTVSVETIRAQAKTATRELAEAYTTLRRNVSDAVRDINTFAANSAKPETVYNLADIAPPQPRGNSLPPAKPTNLAFDLDATTGALVLRWKCSNPSGVSGVVYTVRRRIGTGSLANIGATGEKRFIDGTIPGGTSVMTYEVFGQRGQQVGPTSDAVQVRFGTGSNGEVTIQSVKMAA